MKKKWLLVTLFVVILFAVGSVSADEDADERFINGIKYCAANLTYYNEDLKPFEAGTKKVGGLAWYELAREIREDLGINCGHVASRPIPERLESIEDAVYDAAYLTQIGLEFRLLALEYPEVPGLSEHSKDLLYQADQLYGEIHKIVGIF